MPEFENETGQKIDPAVELAAAIGAWKRWEHFTEILWRVMREHIPHEKRLELEAEIHAIQRADADAADLRLQSGRKPQAANIMALVRKLPNLHGEDFFATRDAIQAAIEQLDEEAGRVHQVVPNGWIAVAERMPAPDTTCLVWARESWRGTDAFGLAIDTWQEQREAPLAEYPSATVPIGLGWDEHDFDEVTHWMPLPEPPKFENVAGDKA
jgi:hypothetical protein